MGSDSALRAISLGYGVQSFTLAAMTAVGDLPPVDVVLHADTTYEHVSTYRFVERWNPWFQAMGVNLVTVTGDSTSRVLQPTRGIEVPAFTDNTAIAGRDSKRKSGRLSRHCTQDWKIVPIRRALSQMLAARGLKKSPGIIELWLGISTDEWSRAKTADVAYIDQVFPLLTTKKMSRQDCVQWLTGRLLPLTLPKIYQDAEGLSSPARLVLDVYLAAVAGGTIPDVFHAIVAPKSACTFCPFHSIDTWKALRRRATFGMEQEIGQVVAGLRGRVEADGVALHDALLEIAACFCGEDTVSDWDLAVLVDNAIRHKMAKLPAYIHPHLKPLPMAVPVSVTASEEEGRPEEASCDSGYCFM